MARLELESGVDVLLLETGDALLLEFEAYTKVLADSVAIAESPALVAEFKRALADDVAISEATIKGVGQSQILPNQSDRVRIKAKALRMAIELENWILMPPNMRSLGIYWPWYKPDPRTKRR